MKKILLAVALILCFCSTAHGQASQFSTIILNGAGHPLAGVFVNVCTWNGVQPPPTCASPGNATLYLDPLAAHGLTQPFQTDGMGNLSFFVAAGNYAYTLSGPSVKTTTYGITVGGAGGGTPGGSTTQVQFNDTGSFNGASAWTFNKTLQLMTGTAGADNQTPFEILPHSGTQYAPLLLSGPAYSSLSALAQSDAYSPATFCASGSTTSCSTHLFTGVNGAFAIQAVADSPNATNTNQQAAGGGILSTNVVTLQGDLTTQWAVPYALGGTAVLNLNGHEAGTTSSKLMGNISSIVVGGPGHLHLGTNYFASSHDIFGTAPTVDIMSGYYASNDGLNSCHGTLCAGFYSEDMGSNYAFYSLGGLGHFPGAFDTVLNTTQGFQYNGAAPLNHCLVGNGTSYVDNNCPGGGSSSLNSITSAVSSNSIANGDNQQVWDWHLTTAHKAGMLFSESTAGTAGQSNLINIQTLAGSTTVPLFVSNSLTGSQNLPAVQLLPNWNTSGNARAFLVNALSTASGSGSLLADFQLNSTSQFNIDKAGNSTQQGINNTVSGFQVNGGAPSGHTLCGNGTAYVDSASCGASASTPLSAVTAAVASNAILNANNPQSWKWNITSPSLAGMEFTESTAATGAGSNVVFIDTLSGSKATPLLVTDFLTGSQTLPDVQIAPNWNTSGVVDAGLLITVTNTASGAGSKVIDAQVNTVSQWNADKAGNTTQQGIENAVGGYQVNGAAASGTILCGNGTIYAPCTPSRPVIDESGSGSILTYAQSDNGTTYWQSNGSASSYGLPIVSSLSTNWSAGLQNAGAGTVTVNITTSTATVCSGSSCSTGQTSFTVTTGQFALIYSNASGYRVKIF